MKPLESPTQILNEPFNGYGNFIEAKPLKHRGISIIALYFDYNKSLISICKELGGNWSQTKQCWYFENTSSNYHKIINGFKGIAWVDIRALQEEKTKEILNKKRNPNWQLSESAKRELALFDKILKTHRYSESSRQTYGNMVKRFLNYFSEQKSQDLKHGDIIDFIHDYVIAGEYSESYQRQMVGALKLFYLKVHRLPEHLKEVSLLKKRRKLPTVISERQAFDLIKACRNLKHKFCIALIYSCGLRIGDALHMQVNDIDLDRMVIDVKDGKGRKDRTVPFPRSLVKYYDRYLAQYKPRKYLFEGQYGGPYSRESINKIIKRAAKVVGIEKRISAHTLRHSFATHLMNKGVNQRFIQEILGHKSSKTTEIYTHVSNANLNLIENPLDEMVAKIKRNEE